MAIAAAPGARIIYDQPDPEYRAVDAASYSALKHMLDSPARYKWERENRVEKSVYDFGHAVHSETLGVGESLRVIAAPNWKSPDTRQQRDDAYAAGEVPLLTHEYEAVQACTAQIAGHPLAGPILTSPGHSEVSIFWTDPDTDLPCKARIDRVTVTEDGTHYLIDVKTVGQTAEPSAFARAAAGFSYHMQGDFYRTGYATATGVSLDQVMWLNVVAEKTRPYLVSVVALDEPSLLAGRARWQYALDQLAHCLASDTWPGYTETEAALISIPQYALKETLE